MEYFYERLTVFGPPAIVIGKYTRLGANTSCCCDCNMSGVMLRLRKPAKQLTFTKDVPQRFLERFVLELRVMTGCGQLFQQPDTMKLALRECITT